MEGGSSGNRGQAPRPGGRASVSNLVAVKDVSKIYNFGKLTVTALAGVSLTVEAGEFLAVAGPSGSGKTTLLNLIGCLDTPTAGAIVIDGEPVGALSPGKRADLRARKLGFIFQTFNLIPVLTAFENVEYPLLIHRRSGDVATRVRAALEQVGLGDRVRHRPTELSGGQQQRVAKPGGYPTKPGSRTHRDSYGCPPGSRGLMWNRTRGRPPTATAHRPGSAR